MLALQLSLLFGFVAKVALNRFGHTLVLAGVVIYSMVVRTQDRCDRILSLAATLIRNKDRRFFYGTTQDAFLSERDALRHPVFLDHQGAWQPLINLQPTATSLKSPARLRLPVALPLFP